MRGSSLGTGNRVAKRGISFEEAHVAARRNKREIRGKTPMRPQNAEIKNQRE